MHLSRDALITFHPFVFAEEEFTELLRYVTYLSSLEECEQTSIISGQLKCHEVTLVLVKMACSHLLLHFFDLPDGAAALGALLVPQQIDVQVSRLAVLFLLLLLGVLQLALSADALCMVHVVCLHHLQGAVRRQQGNKGPI